MAAPQQLSSLPAHLPRPHRQPSWPSRSRSRSALRLAPRPKGLAPTAVGQPNVATRPITETLFFDALVRERARADRFEEAFVLAKVTTRESHTHTNEWQRVIEALPSTTMPGDLVGWLETGTVLGVIRPAVSSGTCDSALSVAAEMQRTIAQRLAPEVAGVVVRTEIYAPSQDVLPAWLQAELSRRRSGMDIVRDVVKRAIDVAGSLAMLVLLAPLLAVVAVLLKATSPGPVFFRQERVGAGGRLFRMNKLRTIRTDADTSMHEQYVESFIAAGPRKPGGEGTICKMVDDPRVTPVGRFLRRWSIDEIPQFWNVLVGEMSLVGPRPALPYEVARYKSWHRRRVLDATPGMTGLWQVSGRSQMCFDEMVALDLRYARHRTIRDDIRILLATPRAVLSGRGAY